MKITKLSRRQTQIIVITAGLLLFLITIVYSVKTDIKAVAGQMDETLKYVKEQCYIYNRYNEASQTKGLMRAIENAQQVNRDLTYTKDEVTEDKLKRSDMYITANSTGGYYDLPENTDCSKWEKPKKDLGLVYWDYYHDDTRTYEKMLDIHAQLSDNVIFAGGSWIWNGISHNYSKTYACTKAALSTCKKYNIKEVLCTAWMDNGAETLMDALLPGLALFSHLDFHRDYDETILKQEFRNCTGGEFDDFMALDNFDSLFLNSKENKEAQNPSKYLLYQDPMLGIFDYHVKESGVNTKSYYQNIQKYMKECAKKAGKYQLLFSFYEKLAAVLADKADLGMCIKSAYDRLDRAALKDISQNVIPEIICNLTDMKSSREKIWMNDAKPFGYEILDIKIGGVITRLKSTGYRIDNYLNGNVLRLEELEEERLPYFTKGMDKRENLWNRIISGCDLNDTI